MSPIREGFEAWKRAQPDGYDAWDAVLWATERAAELCEVQASSYAFIPDKYGEMACDDCAAAIRAQTGGAG